MECRGAWGTEMRWGVRRKDQKGVGGRPEMRNSLANTRKSQKPAIRRRPPQWWGTPEKKMKRTASQEGTVFLAPGTDGAPWQTLAKRK